MFKIEVGPRIGQWLWLCDRHVAEYRDQGIVSTPGPDLDAPRSIESEDTSQLRKGVKKGLKNKKTPVTKETRKDTQSDEVTRVADEPKKEPEEVTGSSLSPIPEELVSEVSKKLQMFEVDQRTPVSKKSEEKLKEDLVKSDVARDHKS